MSKTTKKRNEPSLTYEELQELKSNEQVCPFGRKTLVGDVRCRNCTFNHMDDGGCYGTKESVRIHMKRLGLDY